MDRIPEDRLFEFHSNTLQNVRQEYGLDRKLMREAVDKLQDWINDQETIAKKDFDLQFLENVITAAKGNMDRAKTRLDSYYRMRLQKPLFFVCDISSLEGINDAFHIGVMPRLTNDNYRVIVLKLHPGRITRNSISSLMRVGINTIDYIRAHDYSNGVIGIGDYRGVSILDMISKINIFELNDALKIITDSFGLRLKSMHMITDSRLITLLAAIFKSVMSAKLGNRIAIHKNMDTLYETVQRELLPSDYGGEAKDLKELNGHLINTLSSNEFVNYLQDMIKSCTENPDAQKC